MATPSTDVGLSVWAVTCDALARGEQIFLLVPGAGGDVSALRHEAFWLLPDWEGTNPRALTEPYQDRLRALESLRHRDDRLRLKYFATAEYAEALASPGHLRALDGDHTLNAGAVDRLFRRYADGHGSGEGSKSATGVSLLVLRVRARPEAEVLERSAGTGEKPDGGGEDRDVPLPLDRRWVELPGGVSTSGLDPVVGAERFLSRKARLLQRTGAVRAV
jgi:hypothetical protein